MLSYATYLDASRDLEGVVVVAGYFAPVYCWERFEVDWKLALAKFNVPYFHMKEFTCGFGPFSESRWALESYRASFLATLASIIKNYCQPPGVARALWYSLFEKYNKDYCLSEVSNPYSIAALECVLWIHKHIRKRYSDTAPIEYIVDYGDEGIGHLMKAMEKHGLPPPISRYSKPRKNKPDAPVTVQLQCADFAAWELRKAMVTQGRPGFKEYRKSLQALERSALREGLNRGVHASGNVDLNSWKEFSALDDFCSSNEIARR